MKKLTFLKKVTAAATALTAVLLFSTAVANAIPYAGPDTDASATPAFNVFTGVPSVGNEADFLRARVPANGNTNDTSTLYTDPLATSCEAGTKIQMRVYVHNGADRNGNNDGAGPSVAHDTSVKVNIPTNQSATFAPSASISASNAATVNDTVAINCNGKSVKLKYVAGSAQQFSQGTGVVGLSDSIVTTGAPIRSHDKPGDVYGCWDERVYVVLTVVVEEVVEPPVLKCIIETGKFTVENQTRKVTLAITATATNATVTGYRIDWGDRSTPSTKQSDVHTYASTIGSATITASFTARLADGTTQTVGGADCIKQVNFTSTPTPPTPPTPQPVLPATGAASMVGIFGVSVLAGTLAFRRFLSRY